MGTGEFQTLHLCENPPHSQANSNFILTLFQCVLAFKYHIPLKLGLFYSAFSIDTWPYLFRVSLAFAYDLRRNIKLEAYTRRENLKLFNIEEKDENVDTEEIVRKTLVEKMNIPKGDVERIRFERVHRMRTRKASSKPRPVIAKFSFYQDKEFVWSFVKNLKGSGIGISNDFPKEIDEIHEKLYPILKKAKQDRQSAYFKVDKLIINGQVYRGKETEDLLHYGAIM